MKWRTARRTINIAHPLVMGILNVTPDSFSDGGRFSDIRAAVAHAEQMIEDGAEIIDIGGESTRPGSSQVEPDTESGRVIPIVRELSRQGNTAISIDTTKPDVARSAIEAGAEIINDISGLRWNADLAAVASETGAGLILMHSRGSFETMHSAAPADNVVEDVTAGLRNSIDEAHRHGVRNEQIALDLGIGFGKTLDQNLELLHKLDTIVAEFAAYPMVLGTSRKSFIGKVLGDAPVEKRVAGSVATAIVAAQRGAKILRVHDVKETVDALKLLAAIDR